MQLKNIIKFIRRDIKICKKKVTPSTTENFNAVDI